MTHLLSVSRNGKTGYINTRGRLVIDCVFDVIPPVFYFADTFKNGVAEVAILDKKKNVLRGYIDKNGEYIWEPRC